MFSLNQFCVCCLAILGLTIHLTIPVSSVVQSFGKPCNESSECAPETNQTCSSHECKCPFGTKPLGPNKVCVDFHCSTSSQCSLNIHPNSACNLAEHKCVCSYGFQLNVSTLTCDEKTSGLNETEMPRLGMSCSGAQNCSSNQLCLDGRCQCLWGYFATNQYECDRLECKDHSECTMNLDGNSYCLNGWCQCHTDRGYELNTTSNICSFVTTRPPTTTTTTAQPRLHTNSGQRSGAFQLALIVVGLILCNLF